MPIDGPTLRDAAGRSMRGSLTTARTIAPMDRDSVYAARRSARSVFAVAWIATVLSIPFASIGPGDPMFGFIPSAEQVLFSWLLSGIGIGGVVFGLVWMWRIYRAPTKHESPMWRYRDRA
jgi:hypothetical protein